MSKTYNQSAATTAYRTRAGIGSDGSSEYSSKKGLNLIVCHLDSAAVVSFKCFLEEYSMSFVLSPQPVDFGKRLEPIYYSASGTGIIFKLNIRLIAHSAKEAEVNASRLDYFSKMLRTITNTVNNVKPRNQRTMNKFIVSLSNIISSDFLPISEYTNENLLKIGTTGIIKSFNVTIDKDLGFFETYKEKNSLLYPKSYTLSFDYIIDNQAYADLSQNMLGNGKYMYLPLSKENEYYQYDFLSMGDNKDAETKKFPFGIDPKKNYFNGYDGGARYSSSKKAYFYIVSSDVVGTVLKFKPFVDSFSYDLNTGISEQVKESDFGSYNLNLEKLQVVQNIKISFKVVADSISEAKSNMLKVQTLLRMNASYRPETDTTNLNLAIQDTSEPDQFRLKFPITPTEVTDNFHIKFSNLISSTMNTFNIPEGIDEGNWGKVVDNGLMVTLKGFSLTVDKDMGMFEENKMFYFKSFSVSFDFEMSPAKNSQGVFNITEFIQSDESQEVSKNHVNKFTRKEPPELQLFGDQDVSSLVQVDNYENFIVKFDNNDEE